jgi:hypothetical protein
MQGIYFQIYPIKINNKCQTEVKNQNVSVNTNVERKFAVWLCGHVKKQTKLVKTQTAVREFKFTLTALQQGSWAFRPRRSGSTFYVGLNAQLLGLNVQNKTQEARRIKRNQKKLKTFCKKVSYMLQCSNEKKKQINQAPSQSWPSMRHT